MDKYNDSIAKLTVAFKSQAQFYGSRKLNCLHQTYTRASSCKFVQESVNECNEAYRKLFHLVAAILIMRIIE